MIAKETIAKLRAFASRRRRLILIRGICAFVMSLLLIMTGLALLDRFLIIPDMVRWVLSAIGYGAVGFILWRVCLRHFFHHTNRRELARMVEHADPSLREDLVSAIELGSKKSEANAEFDSPQFRALLQKDVAGRLSSIEVKKLLPSKIVSIWTRMAVVAVLVAVALSFIPGLHFPQLLSRALLPGANLERPSDIIVTFIEPSPTDRIVASGDTVEVMVEISGGSVDKVILETYEGEMKGEKTKLTRVKGNRFSGGISVNFVDIDYRVRAEGTITKVHKLKSRPRPQATQFAKSYTYPSYTGLPGIKESHDHGDVSALEGSEVALEITVNQKLSKAELHLQSLRKETEENVVELVQGEDGLLRGVVPINADYNFYRVHLEAEESGFTNKFSPDYEIRSVPDLVPTVVMVTPETNTEVALNTSLPVAGMALDDVGLAEIRQEWRINKEEWQERVLLTKPEGENLLEMQTESAWELRSLPLKARDTLFTRLVAVDTKGNRGESPVVRLVVTAEPDNLQKRAWAEKEKELAKTLNTLREKTAEAARAIGEAKKELKKEDALDVEDQQKVVLAQAETADAQREADRAWEQLKEMQREAPSRAEAEQLKSAAEALAQIRNQKLERAEEAIQDWGKADKEEFGQQDEMADRHGWEAHDLATRLADAAKARAAEDEAEILADDLKSLAEKQKEVAEAARNNETAEAAKEQQEIAGARSENLEKALDEFAQLTEGGERGTAERESNELERDRKELEQAIAQSEEKPDKGRLQRVAEEMTRQAEDAARNMENMQNTLANRADEMQRKLDERNNEASREVQELVNKANELVHKRELAEKATESGDQNQAEAREEEVAILEEEIQERLEGLADTVRDEAEFAEQNSMTNDLQENADMQKAAQVMDDLADSVEEEDGHEAARELAQNLENLKDALEAIEAGDAADDLAQALDELADAEHNASGQQEQAREGNPENFEAIAEQMKELPKALQQVADAQEAVKEAQQAMNSQETNQLKQEMNERARADENRAPQPKSGEAEKLQEQMEKVSEAIEPQVADARDALEQMAPSIPEQLRDLAADAQAQADAADALAENASGESMEDIAAKAEEMIAQSEDTAERMEEISTALAAEANTEDLLTEESRDSARDADDAIARLEANADAPAETMENLNEAADAKSADIQERALEMAANEQAALAENLNTLADQLEAAAGEDAAAAEEARLALRESESETGVESALDQAYEQAAELAQLMEQAGTNPEDALAALEQELQRNEPMQESLSEMAQESLGDAAQMLANAAAAEGQVGDMLEQAAQEAQGQAEAQAQQPESSPQPTPQVPQQMANAAQQQPQVAEQVGEAASELASAARHEERLGNEALSEALTEASEETQALATNEASQAMQAIDNAQQQSQQAPSPQAAQQASAAADAAQNAIAEQAGQLSAMASQESQEGSAQQPQASPTAPQSLDPDQDGEIGPFDSGNPEQGQFLAEALDALDQALNDPQSQMAQNQEQGQSPAESQNQGQQSPQQSQAEGQSPSESQSQSQAQQSIASAAQSQAQAMAQARAQNMAPGQMSPSQMQAMMAAQSSKSALESKDAIRAQAMAMNGQLLLSQTDPGETPEPLQDWSKLPAKVAKDLIEGQRQEVSPDYRSAVESYYKAIAEKAGKK
jgi:hypothetical protein